LVVDVGNYVVGPYNGTFNATLSINFYNLKAPRSELPPEYIIPIAKVDSSGVSNYFSLPNDEASTPVTIPHHTSRLILEVFASGNGQEEFWYSNVPSEYANTFAPWNATFLGQGPFREVVVCIDDVAVAVLWPFEVVFTGGICPGFWRPIVGHRTFDLPSYSFDFTSYIKYLHNGIHSIEFKVRGQPKTLQNWYVSGHLRIWSSEASDGASDFTSLTGISPKANVTTTGSVASDNSSFSVTTCAKREEEIFTLDYQNNQTYRLLENGTILKSNVSQITTFSSPLFEGWYAFSLETEERDYPDGTLDLEATLSQTFHRLTRNDLNSSLIEEHAEVFSVGKLRIGRERNLSQGNTSVLLNYKSPTRTYHRDVEAIGFKIIRDSEKDELVSTLDRDRLHFQAPNFW
jgi:hypothetical protein